MRGSSEKFTEDICHTAGPLTQAVRVTGPLGEVIDLGCPLASSVDVGAKGGRKAY
jgi:hypothetical protein